MRGTLLAAAIGAVAGAPALADVRFALPDEPHHVAFQEEAGPFMLVRSYYAPTCCERPPYKPPFGLTKIGLEWQPDGTSVLLILQRDRSGYSLLKTSRRAIGLRNRCWHVTRLNKAMVASPAALWRRIVADFDPWYRGCDAFDQGRLSSLSTVLRRHRGSAIRAIDALARPRRHAFLTDQPAGFGVATLLDRPDEPHPDGY